MDQHRWDEVRATFDALIELDPIVRATRLTSLGATNPTLCQVVESLLAADAEADERLAPLDAGIFTPLARASDPLGLVGNTVSHFHVLAPLGAGGMGVVYRAEDTRLGRAVALKFLLPQSSLDAAAKTRFLQEARSAAALDHPNLCTVHEVGESEDGRVFLAMALYAGETLKARLDREGPLPVGDALDIAEQIARGLSCAHAAGIVHRDLKPGNVMLVPNGPVKILDFGLAKARDQSLSVPGSRVGTASYMAPEQVRGETVDACTDLWALGVVLYEMLTGQKPFPGDHEVAIAHAILYDAIPSAAMLRAAMPSAVEDLIGKLLQKDPARRYRAADELLVHIVSMRSHAELSIRSAKVRGARFRWPFTVNPRRILTVAAIVAVAAGGLVTGKALLVGRNVTTMSQAEITQLTFGGNARTPALSPDGLRLAYSVRQCGTNGRCNADVVVQDMEGAGKATVARGLANVYNIQWASNGRYLVVLGDLPGSPVFGPYSVPSLGGMEPRYLGCCRGVVAGSSDTVLVAADPGNDTATWVRWVTVADGTTHDSLLLRRPPGWVRFWVDPLAGSDRLLTLALSTSEVLLGVVQRDGRILDSLRLESPILVHASPDGTGVLVWQGSRSGPDAGDPWQYPLDLVRYPLGADGHFASRPDTILKGLLMALSGPWILPMARNGNLVYASGSASFDLWLLQRTGARGVITGRRRLAVGTGYMDGKFSPDAERVGVLRGVVIRERRLKQLYIMSSDSGPETPVGSPQDVVQWEWTPDGSKILLAVRVAPDSLALEEMDLPGGANRVLAKVGDVQLGGLAAFSDGGLAFVGSGPQVHRLGIPGLADTLFTVPEDLIGIAGITPTPGQHTVTMIAVKHQFDTLLVSRISLVDGRVSRVAGFVAQPSGDPPALLRDGSLIVSLYENQDIVWYLMPKSGGHPVRLGAAPWSTANYRWSADGRRVLATVHNELADVYAIRNFGALLGR
ncbi:MAG TPA: protein kinase [Steroidobacteraceae bacterium]